MLTDTFEVNYGTGVPDTVLRMDTLEVRWSPSTPGWNGFDLDTPFSFEGTSSLIVEFQYLGSTSTCINVKAVSQPSADRTLDAGHPLSSTGDGMTFYNCMRIHFIPTGTGEESEVLQDLSLEPKINPLSIYIDLLAVSQVETRGVIKAYGIDGRDLGIVWEGTLYPGENSICGDGSGLLPVVCFLILKTRKSRASTRILLLR